MNIGIITIHNVSNYGAVLQSYALKEVVKSKYNCSIIDFDNRHVSKSLDMLRVGKTTHAFLGTVKDILRILPRSRVIPKFKNFIKSELDISEYSGDNLSKFNVLISGSDQIWNPACVSSDDKFVPEYFLSFAKDGQKKISYASSCGSYKYNKSKEIELNNYLSQYSSLSTREYQASKFLSNLTKKNVEHVLDPTLLLTKEDWIDRIGDNHFRKGDYILLYVIKKTPLLKEVIKKIKSDLGIKVILVEQGLHFDPVVDEHIRDAGPKDFISLVNNARFVVTDSFHGTTFSTIFNKPFFSVSPGANINRISSLLEVLGLESRIIHDMNDLVKVDQENYSLCFEQANLKLDEQREKSKNFLFSSIE